MSDLFGNQEQERISILQLRNMKSNKAKEEIILQLHKQAENFVNGNSWQFIYIKGNVSSSKNSKEIGRFKKRNAETGVLEPFTTLVNSKVTKEYIATSKPQWIVNKHKFEKLIQGLKMPLKLEFTFIRDSLRKFDFVNAAQLPLDLLAEYGYIPDDETEFVIPIFNEQVFYSKKYAGVLINVIGGNKIELPF